MKRVLFLAALIVMAFTTVSWVSDIPPGMDMPPGNDEIVNVTDQDVPEVSIEFLLTLQPASVAPMPGDKVMPAESGLYIICKTDAIIIENTAAKLNLLSEREVKSLNSIHDKQNEGLFRLDIGEYIFKT